MNPLRALHELGQSVWYDNITRSMLGNGELARMVEEDGLRGLTSNPTIFEKAIAGSNDYDASLRRLLASEQHATDRDLFFAIAIEDIQAAADLFLPVYRAASGHDGLVSLEVSPDLAYDAAATVTEARHLWQRVNRPNLMIKVPATKEGLQAVETLTADGINVNATLLFSVTRYREVVDAYLAGIEARLRAAKPVEHIASVASFFVSRVDGAVDKLLQSRADAQARQYLGRTAIANAKLAYATYLDAYQGPQFAKLAKSGARPQRLLWASTGTKSKDYSDVLYIETLIGPNTVSTIPPATYAAFKDHGKVHPTLDTDIDGARALIEALAGLDINIDAVTSQLEDEGVKAFAASFDTLLRAIGDKTRHIEQVSA